MRSSVRQKSMNAFKEKMINRFLFLIRTFTYLPSRGRNADYSAPPALGIEIRRAHEKVNSFLGIRRFQLRGK